MLDNLITLLDEESFINKYGYGKEFQKVARDNIYQLLNLLQFDLLPSSYFGDDYSNNYSIVLKGVAEETARLYLLALFVQEDIYFDNVRSDFLFQNVGSYVGLVAERLFQLGLDDKTFREFLIAITKAYFGGATKASMESALAIYPGPIHNYNDPTQITYLTLQEIYLDLVAAGVNPDIALQWSFYLNIDHPEYISDINAFTTDVKFFVEIIKPAHTLSIINFIYKEPEDGGTITQNMKDLHREELFFYAYEDFRDNCYAEQLPEIIYRENITTNFFLPDQGFLNHRPIVTSSGGLGDIYDVIIETELGGYLSLTELNPYTGEFTISGTVPIGEMIFATYFRQVGKTFTAVTNNLDLQTNQGFNEVWDNRNPYQAVTNSPEPQPIPITINYKWHAFELPNSALFNEVRDLVLNGDQHIGNRLNLYQNTGSKGYQRNEYHLTLNEGTPIYPLSQARTRYTPEPYPMGLILNEPEDRTNNLDDFLFTRQNPPTTIVRDITQLDDIYGAMEVDRTLNSGISGILKPICDKGFTFNLGLQDYIESVKPDRDVQPAYLNTMTFLNTATLNGENPVLVINIVQTDHTSDNITTPVSDQDYMQLSGYMSDNFYQLRNNVNFVLNSAGGAKAGDTVLYGYDLTLFPPNGTLLIGTSCGIDFEIVSYSSKYEIQFHLDFALAFNHAANEPIVLVTNDLYPPSTTVVGASEQNELDTEDLLFNSGLNIEDDWIKFDFSNPVGTYWLDGNGTLRLTPLHTP
jgi:hypothetical protein